MKLLVLLPLISQFVFVENAELGHCLEGNSNVCVDEICYVHHTRHEEGIIESIGCASNKSLSTLCYDGIPNATHGSMCISDGGTSEQSESTTCCCASTNADYCNKNFRHKPYFRVDGDNILTMVVVLLYLLLWWLVMAMLRRFRLLADLPTPVTQFVSRWQLRKAATVIFLQFALLVLLWFPVQVVCQPHPDGNFVDSMNFYVKYFPTPEVGLFYCLIPMFLLVTEYSNLHYSDREYLGVQFAQSIIAQLATVVPLYYGIPEIDKIFDSQAGYAYCKFTTTQEFVLDVSGTVYVVSLCLSAFMDAIMMFGGVYIYYRMPEETEDEVTEELVADDSSVETAIPFTKLKNELVHIEPRPFVISSRGGVLQFGNKNESNWIALRMISSSAKAYTIQPDKMLIPPQRTVSIEVNIADYEFAKNAGLMLQWFVLGPDCTMNATEAFTRPYPLPMSQWKFFVIPVFHTTSAASPIGTVA